MSTIYDSAEVSQWRHGDMPRLLGKTVTVTRSGPTPTMASGLVDAVSPNTQAYTADGTYHLCVWFNGGACIHWPPGDDTVTVTVEN